MKSKLISIPSSPIPFPSSAHSGMDIWRPIMALNNETGRQLNFTGAILRVILAACLPYSSSRWGRVSLMKGFNSVQASFNA
jgi:hypothetical protein